jgi:hypothetical protein
MLPLGIVVLVAFHLFFFNRLRHAGVSLAVVSGVVLLAIAKHLGLFGSLYGLLRRRSRHLKQSFECYGVHAYKIRG